MFITFEPHGISFDQILHTHVNIPLPLACKTTFLMDEGLLSISPACCGQFVKSSYLLNRMGYLDQICILIYLNIVQPLVCKTVRRVFAECHFGPSRYFSENAHNS